MPQTSAHLVDPVIPDVPPPIIFADEPTSRLDPLTQRETFELLGQALDDQGSALLLVTHDPDIAGRVADRTINVGPCR